MCLACGHYALVMSPLRALPNGQINCSEMIMVILTNGRFGVVSSTLFGWFLVDLVRPLNSINHRMGWPNQSRLQ